MRDQIILPLSDYNSASRYKAEVRVVSPEIARSDLTRHNSCFVGISLESANFLGNKLQSIIDYISTRYSHCVFLLGDHVHRLTLQIRKTLNEEQSRYHALALGDYFLRTQGHMLCNSETGEAFPVIRGSDIHRLPIVQSYLMQLQEQFSTDLNFNHSVKEFAKVFIARSDKDDDETEHDSQLITYSCQYVLEELAETCYMISQGHCVLVYPGSLAIFQQIADGLFAGSGLPAELNHLVNIGLRLKRRGKKAVATVQHPAHYC